jgi:hypothetical protein
MLEKKYLCLLGRENVGSRVSLHIGEKKETLHVLGIEK